MPEGKTRFKRQIAVDRRKALIEATIQSLKQHGHEGLSVRRIAAEANVSIGLINHHFPSIDVLIAEAYRHFSNELFATVQKAIAGASPSPRARLHAFLKSSFTPPTLDRDALTVWLVFWGLHRHSEEIQRVHDETYGGYLKQVRELLGEVVKESGKTRFNLRLAAIGLTAMLDGLWLELCLDPDNFQPKEAVALCESWIETVCS